MKRLLLILLSFVTLSSYSQWVLLNSGVSDHLNSIQFLNKDTGYCVGRSFTILKTINGGSNWVLKYSLLGNNDYVDQEFFNDTGYIAGYETGLTGPKIHLEKTTNGANSIASSYSIPPVSFLTSSDFINSQVGWIVGGNPSGGLIFHTTNGGTNWVTQTPVSNTYLKDVHFPVLDTGYICGGNNIQKTSNSGSNWVVQNTGLGSTVNLNSIYFVNPNIGYCVGSGGTIIKTTNGGATWTTQVSTSTVDLYSIFFITSQKGYAVGLMGTILYTNNGGTTWTQQNSGVTTSLNSVHFVDSLTGYISGNNGVILKTTNGGVLSINDHLDINSMHIFPNPTTDKISVRFNSSFRYNLVVYNMVGEVVLNKNLFGDTEIDLSKFVPGVYNLSISTEKGALHKKIVKH